jgi:RES domain-containing protein
VRACASCFKAQTWISNSSPPESSPANCDFGHDYSAQTWPTTAWVDALTRLVSVYEAADDGELLETRIQDDWAVFTLSDDQVRQFLHSVFEDGHELLQDGVQVRLRRRSDGEAADHIASWTAFSDEIRSNNRYFPRSVPDRELLSRVLLETAASISTDVDMYRARPSGQRPFPRHEMGAPPATLASAGRANPVGIPYLYLAYSVATCVYETRASNHARVCIARFRPARKLTVLNLADIEAPDFFSIPEVESIDDQVSQVELHRYLRALSNELSKPVRASDQPTDYIPTQYLCELAKSLRLDGVLYSSSLEPGGRNIVLFDVDSAQSADEPYLVEITSLTVEWEIVTAPP